MLLAIGLGAVLGTGVAWEPAWLFNTGLYPLSQSAADLYLWPLTALVLVLILCATLLWGGSDWIHRNRQELLLYFVTVAPFFAGLNLGPIDPSDPAFLVAFLSVIIILSVERWPVRFEPIVFICCALIIIFTFTSIFGGRMTAIMRLHTIITKVLLVFIVCQLIRSDNDIAKFVKGFLVCGVLSALLAVGSEAVFMVTGIPFTFDDSEDFHYKYTPFGKMLRATGFMATTQGLAHVMVIGCALALTAPMSLIMRGVLVGMMGIGCFTTFSAGSYVSIGVVFMVAPFIMFRRHWVLLITAYTGAGVLLFFTGLWKILLNDIMIPLGLRNFLERMEFIRRGLRGAENWPWTGNGVGNIGRHLETAVHNAYFQSVVDIGVIGGLVFLAMVLYLLVRNLMLIGDHSHPGSRWAPSMTLVMVGIFVHLLLEPFFNNTVTWLLYGVATANLIILRATPNSKAVAVPERFDQELDLSLSGYLSTLYRMRYVILLVMMSAGFFGYIISKSIEPRYEAVAQFYLPEATTRSGASESELPSAPVPSGNRDGVTAAVSVLRTPIIREKVHELVPEKSVQAMELDVDPVVERSSMVHVYVRDKDPEIAAKTANAYFQVFVDFIEDNQESRQRITIERTLSRLEELDQAIADLASQDRDRMQRLLSLRETLTSTQQNMEKQVLRTAPPAILASPAKPPASPVFPVIPLNVIVSMIAGLVLGVIYAVILDHFRMVRRKRRVLRLAEDATIAEFMRDLGVPPQPGSSGDRPAS
ncbi:MAG: hypothetical protein ACPGNV_15235 [Mangrovicoccus sp.]